MTDIRELLHSATPFVDDLDVNALRRGAGRRRARRFAATALALVVVGTTTVVALSAGRHSRRHVVIQGPSTTVAPSSAASIFDTAGTGVDLLPAPPVAPRAGAAVVWTGTSLAMWGGNLDAPNMGLAGPYRSFNDGAVYDPATRNWTPMAASPLPIGEQAAGVRTDDGIVFTQGRETAIWHPETNTWRRLDDAPAPAFDLTFTGSLVVSYSANATLDPRSGAWRALPEIPVQLDRTTFTWTGQELFVMGGPGTPFTSAAAIALDPERREWRRIADPPPALHAEALSASWDGRRVVVVNYDMRAVAYDPTQDAWMNLPNVPARFSEWSPTAVSVGGYTAAFMAHTAAVLTPSGAWIPLPYGQIPLGSYGILRTTPRSADEVLLMAGVRNDGTNVIAAIDLARLVAATSRLQVGIGNVRPPQEYRLRSTHFEAVRSGAGTETVSVDLGGPDGATCSVKSIYSGVVPPTFGSLVEVTLHNDGEATSWYRNAPGTEWRRAATTSDSLTVECSDPDVARELAESASFKYSS